MEHVVNKYLLKKNIHTHSHHTYTHHTHILTHTHTHTLTHTHTHSHTYTYTHTHTHSHTHHTHTHTHTHSHTHIHSHTHTHTTPTHTHTPHPPTPCSTQLRLFTALYMTHPQITLCNSTISVHFIITLSLLYPLSFLLVLLNRSKVLFSLIASSLVFCSTLVSPPQLFISKF